MVVVNCKGTDGLDKDCATYIDAHNLNKDMDIAVIG